MIHPGHSSTFRPLGAFEHIIDLYISRNPVQFSIAVELTSQVTPAAAAVALAALQRAHPLLAARIDRDDHPPTFRREDTRATLRLVNVRDWVVELAVEQMTPINAVSHPLFRAALVRRDADHAPTVMILTFSHQIADGRGALRAVHDFVELLDGRAVEHQPLPASQERLLASTPAVTQAIPETPASTETPRPATAEIRPFDAAPPMVEIAALDPYETIQLRSVASAFDATVQGALCAAAAQVLSTRNDRTSIRINVPIDLRSAAGLSDAVANRFTATIVELDDPIRRDFWTLAHDATGQLRAARSVARSAALMLASLQPADAKEAESAMLVATNADVQITNLGVFTSESTDIAAVWGPTMMTQVRDEVILGVVTFGGTLRLTATGHGGISGILASISSLLTNHSDQAVRG